MISGDLELRTQLESPHWFTSGHYYSLTQISSTSSDGSSGYVSPIFSDQSSVDGDFYEDSTLPEQSNTATQYNYGTSENTVAAKK